ncbi:MAG: hypothetical protein COC19_02055 [SAR86 cluster bacterium]|uniref:DUF1302 domain-containing protein n=1 Tax=SAR86 cluster bacterium TaxID=2030880 RepID=A0A2A4MSS0_9GAMM|nr:MAG: hypothetical protein COC19_02055 [SAR86 cluster bacterium]
MAQDDFFGNISVDITNNQDPNKKFQVLGSLSQKIGFGLEQPSDMFARNKRQLSKVETILFTQLDTKLGNDVHLRVSAKLYHDEIYRLGDDGEYSSAEISRFRNRFEVRDLYLEKSFDNGLYVKFGKQVLAWGQAEYLRVSDLINIEDQYTFGQQDLEDIRLQVPALLVSFTRGAWTFDNVVTYKAGRNKTSPKGDEFDQLIALRDQFSLGRVKPDQELEYFLRASTHYSRGDLEIVAADFNDNQLGFENFSLDISNNSPSLPLPNQINFTQQRMQALAASGNWVNGPWLVFAEAGRHFNKAITPSNAEQFNQLNGHNSFDQTLTVLGVEYNGFSNTLLSFEADNVVTNTRRFMPEQDINLLSFSTRAYWTALNQRLEVLAIWTKLADNAGRVGRLTINYDVSDSIDLGFLWVDYHGNSNSILFDYRNNDVVQIELSYNFQN